MTGSKTTIRFTDSVLPIIRCWRARGWDVQDIVNAAVVLFHMASADQREAAMTTANIGTAVPLSDVSDDEEFRRRVLEMLESVRDIPAGSEHGRKAKGARGH